MALSRQQKEVQVADLTDKMKNASSVIFAQYLGLTVSDITKLRSNLRKEKAEMKVAKKTLIRLAAKNANAPEPSDEMFTADIACIFSFGEATGGASAAYKFGKDHPHIKIVGGIFEGKLLSGTDALALGTMPSKLQLIGMFMAMCNAPLTQFVGMCNSPLTGFARALAEVAKKKEAAAPAPAAAPVAEASPTPAPNPNPAPAAA